VNTTGAAVDEVFFVNSFANTLHLDAGNYVRVTGTGLTLTIAGQTLSGNFTFARDTTVPAAPVVTVSFTNGELGLGDGTTKFVRITNATGSLTLISSGLYGTFAAAVAVDVPNVSFDGSLHVELNTTLVTHGTITPGFRIAGHASLTVAGQSLTGDFTIVQDTPNHVVSVSVTGLGLTIG